jgi:hypothetical protein
MLSKKCWDARLRKRSRVSLSIAILCAKEGLNSDAISLTQKQRILLLID